MSFLNRGKKELKRRIGDSIYNDGTRNYKKDRFKPQKFENEYSTDLDLEEFNFNKKKKREVEERGEFSNLEHNPYEEYNLMPGQRPESFHFFILENQYRDLERAIRGVKDVWDNVKEKWVIKRKTDHCFTDEESEEIIRTAQSHLSTDLKLAIFNREEYPILLNMVYDQIWTMFREIMEYRFGRFGDETIQRKMKEQATNIFSMLLMRIKANYSRAIDGHENKATHDSVKAQESLQQTERKDFDDRY